MLSKLPTRQNLSVTATLLTCLLFYVTFRAQSVQPAGDWNYQDIIPSNKDDRDRTLHDSTYDQDRGLRQIFNETLGFQEIYMISLPTRTDKRDTFTLQAALSSIKFSFADGVDGNLVSLKALPHGMNQSANVLGCWRAHMNVFQKMVHEDVTTALIFEDDADWDVSLRQQLVQFARGSRFVTNTTNPEAVSSPYGENWDILWIGHCGTGYHEEDNRRMFVIPNDATVVPPENRQNVDQPDMSHWEAGSFGDNQTRIVFNSKGGTCTQSYAISQQGARKALYHMGMVPYDSPIDWGLADLCKSKDIGYTCISVFPQIIGVSRPTGDPGKNSDIDGGNGDSGTVVEARSHHVVFSTRLNMEKLLGGETVFDSQFPDVTGPQMHIDEIGAAVGHIEILLEEDLPKSKVIKEVSG